MLQKIHVRASDLMVAALFAGFAALALVPGFASADAHPGAPLEAGITDAIDGVLDVLIVVIPAALAVGAIVLGTRIGWRVIRGFIRG